MLSPYAIALLSAQGAWREGWSEDALRSRLTELEAGPLMAHADTEATISEQGGRSRRGDGLLVIEGVPALELGAGRAIELGWGAPLIEAPERALLIGKRGDRLLYVGESGRVIVDSAYYARSVATLIERELRLRDLTRSTYLFHTPEEHIEAFAQHLNLTLAPEASDEWVRAWTAPSLRAIAHADTHLTIGLPTPAACKDVIHIAAEHDLPIRLDIPSAVLQVRPPAKAPPGPRAKGIEARAWCPLRRETGVVRFERKRRFMTLSQWLFVGEQVTEIMRPFVVAGRVESITRERFIGLTDELDDLLSTACVAWLRARGATLELARRTEPEALALRFQGDVPTEVARWESRFGGLSVSAERDLRVGIDWCSGGEGEVMAEFGDVPVRVDEDGKLTIEGRPLGPLPVAIERWLLRGQLGEDAE